jgi:predicted nucleic acid-binding protein
LIVIDASALLKVLLNTASAELVADRMFASRETLHAPHLIDLEVAQVLRCYALAGEIDAGRGSQPLSDLADLGISRYSHDFLLPRVWQSRNNLTAYDAAYVALAETLNCPLITRDRALAEAPGHDAQVRVIA